MKDKEIKSIFDNLSVAIEKEIKLQLQSAIFEIEEERSVIGYLERKFYEKKFKKLFKEYKNNIMTFGKVVKYSKEEFINSNNNDRDITILKEEYKNERLRTAFILARGSYYVKAEILEYLKLKAIEETDGQTHQKISEQILSTPKVNREKDADSIAIDEKKEILNFKEGCHFLKMKAPTLYKYTSKRLIPFIKKSKNIYFKRKELEEWLEEGRKKTQCDIAQSINTFSKRN